MHTKIHANTISLDIDGEYPSALFSKQNLGQANKRIPRTKLAFFPKNTDNKILSHIKKNILWFKLTAKDEKTPTEIKDLEDFKWKHNDHNERDTKPNIVVKDFATNLEN